MSSLDKFTSALIGAPLGKLPVSDNFSFFELMCSSLSSSRTCSTVVCICNDVHDDDDPPCATCVETVCDVENTGETCTFVCSENTTFFRFGSASDTERDILSCASLTLALGGRGGGGSGSEEMAWMTRIRHCPCGHAKAPGSLLLHSQYIQRCTHIWPTRQNF